MSVARDLRTVIPVFVLIALLPIFVRAECNLDEVIGYTLVAKKTISGRIDKEGRKDDYQGCDFDRVLVFDDNTGVRCATYSYTYSYRPTAYIWVNGSSIKMCVDGSYVSVMSLR